MSLLQVLFLLAVVAVVAAVAVGRVGGGLLAPTSSSPFRGPFADLGSDDELDPADLDDVKFSVVLRGYRMDEVDEVLDRLALELGRRDEELSWLRDALSAGEGTTVSRPGRNTAAGGRGGPFDERGPDGRADVGSADRPVPDDALDPDDALEPDDAFDPAAPEPDDGPVSDDRSFPGGWRRRDTRDENRVAPLRPHRDGD